MTGIDDFQGINIEENSQSRSNSIENKSQEISDLN